MSDHVTKNQPNITFAIIKHDAIKNGVDSAIIKRILDEGFIIIHRHPETITKISTSQTVKFYYEHIGRPYFPDLLKSFVLGAIPLILEADGDGPAVTRLRKLIGATNSREAESNTIRGLFGGHIFNPDAPVAENAIHASDSLISAINEIKIIFPELTTIKSVVHGEFPLDLFQIGDAILPRKIKILKSDYNDFMSLRDPNKSQGHKLGRQFYDRFKLYESILKEESSITELCNKDGEDALKMIEQLVEFV